VRDDAMSFIGAMGARTPFFLYLPFQERSPGR
jgi:hypothetical protein